VQAQQMGQIPLAGFFENGQVLFTAAFAAGEPADDARYTFSLLRQGRESKAERSFPNSSVSINTK
jgi:hypothetical protein